MDNYKLTAKANDEYKLSRIAYILYAVFEYFISIVTSGTYLAKLTTTIGISDGMTAILSSVSSLAGVFQIISIFVAHKTPVKRWVVPILVSSHALIATLYIIPFLSIGSAASIVFFIIVFSTSMLKSIISPAQSNWGMSLTDDKNRGSYQSIMSIVSIAGGMVFSFFASSLIDKFEAAENINGAFITLTAIIFTLASLELIFLVMTKEKPIERTEQKSSPFSSIKVVFSNKNFIRFMIFSVLWSIMGNISTPFYSTYQIKELGFSMTFISTVGIVLSFLQMPAIFLFGRWSKKHSYAGIMLLSGILQIFALSFVVFSTPQNGYFTFTAYRTVALVAMSARTVSEMALVFHITRPEERTGALAVRSIISGILSFSAILIIKPIFESMQAKEIFIFGARVYAQQILTAVSVTLAAVLVIYFYFLCYRPILAKDREKENADSHVA